MQQSNRITPQLATITFITNGQNTVDYTQQRTHYNMTILDKVIYIDITLSSFGIETL